MSGKQMTLVWELALPHNKRLILLALADHADDAGRCFPGVDYLAWKTGYERQQVMRILAALCANSLIEVEHQGGGRGRANVYRLRLENGVKKSPYSAPELRKGINMAPFAEETAPECHPLAQKGDKKSPIMEDTVSESHALDGKGDILMPSGEETVPECDGSPVNSDISESETVTFEGLKGDIAMSPEPRNRNSENQENPPSLCSVPPLGLEAPFLRTPGETQTEIFVPPSLQEVQGYAVELGQPPTMADDFHDHGLRVGWVVGQAARPMADWRAAFRHYARHAADFGPSRSRGQDQPPPPDPGERQRQMERRRREAEERDSRQREEDRVLGAIAALSPREREALEQEAWRRVPAVVRGKDPECTRESTKAIVSSLVKAVFRERYRARASDNWRGAALPV